MKNTIAVLFCAAALYSCGDVSSDSQVEEVTDEKEKVQLSDEVKSALPDVAPVGATNLTQADFDEYAWLMFVAMNWPASETERGMPDLLKQIGDPGAVVWQSLRTSESVFQANGADPGNWNAGWDTRGGYKMAFKSSDISKVSAVAAEHLKSIDQAVGGSLNDQDGNYTYYQKFMNKTEYTYVHDKKYYDKSILNAETSDLILPNQSMEVKSSWKIMTAKDTQSEFFTTPAIVEQPDGTSLDTIVGLVGLHITMKTPGAPQWVWATFEHKNNVPGDPGSTATSFSYNNPDCDTCTDNQAMPISVPTQVTRYTPIEPDAVAANSKWQGLLTGTVFENYQLITMQWPSDPNDPGNPGGSPTPNISANTTMETYIQRVSNCMTCHNSAGTTNGIIKTDYSFLFLEAQSSK
jgi:hypothetical protein